MLFYSRYQSNDPDDFVTELTRMQSSLVQSSGQYVHRKPYLYEMPQSMSYEQLRVALYRTISSHAMLQVWLRYNRKQHHYEQYIVQLPPINEWEIPIVEIDVMPETYIITQETSIPLLEGYPWRVKFLQYGEKPYLYIEFHSICMDYYGIKCFEDTLFKSMRSGFHLPSDNLSSYRLMRNMEIISSDFRRECHEPLKLNSNHKRSMKMVAASYELSNEQMAIIEQIKNRFRVETAVVFQLIVEHMLGYDFKGKLYGMVDNWRSTLRNYDEVGCFNYMNAEVVQGLSVMRSRLMALQLQRQKRKEGEFTALSKRTDFSVVYSYEEVLCQRLVEVPADQTCLYELFIRIRHGITGTSVQLEYSPEHYSREQIQQYFGQMLHVIEALRQQLLTNCAS